MKPFQPCCFVVIANLLAQGKQINYFSLLVLGINSVLIILCLANTKYVILMIAVLLMAIAQQYYAIRVAFDKALFNYFAEQTDGVAEKTQQLDELLIGLHLTKANNENRHWFERSQGALRLLKKQLICCGMQLVLLICIVVYLTIIN